MSAELDGYWRGNGVVRAFWGKFGKLASGVSGPGVMLTRVTSVAAPYVEVLRVGGAWRFYVWTLFPRMGGAMLGLGLVWLIHWSTDSYGAAGIVAGGYALVGAVAGPFVARFVDGFGQRRIVPLLLVINAVAIVGLVAAAAADLPLLVLTGIAAFAAIFGPQVPALSRARWSHLHAGSEHLSTAFALESLTDEVPFILGPALVGTISALVHPAVGELAAAVLLLGGGIPFALQRSGAPPPLRSFPASRRRRGFSPTLPFLLGVFAAFGLIFGAMQVSVTAAAIQSGQSGLAGPMYSAFSLLSMIAGIAYGAIHWKIGIQTRLFAATTALAALSLPLLIVDHQPWLAIAVALPGLAIAPGLIAVNTLTGELAGRRALTQTFTWTASAMALGLAGGQSLAGQAADTLGVHWGFALSTLGAAAGAILTFILWSTMPKTDPWEQHSSGT